MTGITVPVKDFYCGGDPNREKPENDIKKEKLSSSRAGDLITLEHDIFFEDVVLYTSLNDKDNTMLIRGVDYELEDEDSIATDQSGWRCYKKVKILKTQEKDIFADYRVYGDFIDCNLFNVQLSLSKDAREDITSLENKAKDAEAKLSENDARITANENNIRDNLGKINRNEAEIRGAKSEIQDLRDTIEKEKIARQGDVADIKGRLDAVDGGIRKNQDSEKEIRSQLGAIMPIGFCYIQPQDTDTPAMLWPAFQWEKLGEMSESATWKRIG